MIAYMDHIASAEQHAGRDAGSVRLLAATKTRDVGEIMAAIDAGVRMIGENRPQEVMAKAEGLMARCGERGFALGVADDAGASTIAGEHIPFHLIGQLQSNKIGKVLPVVNTIESVDSLGGENLTQGRGARHHRGRAAGSQRIG